MIYSRLFNLLKLTTSFDKTNYIILSSLCFIFMTYHLQETLIYNNTNIITWTIKVFLLFLFLTLLLVHKIISEYLIYSTEIMTGSSYLRTARWCTFTNTLRAVLENGCIWVKVSLYQET